jgi:fucose permease
MMAAYVGMGLPTAALGVAWKSMRVEFHRPLSSLGVLVVTFTLGYLVATAGHRWVAARSGPAPLLAVASVLGAAGAFGFALTHLWVVLLVGAAVTGLSAGTVDAALNAQVALHHSHRMMNLMHGSFGVGATLGPLVMTALVGSGLSWRWGYAAMGVLQIGLVAGFVLTAEGWARPGRSASPPVELGEVELPAVSPVVPAPRGTVHAPSSATVSRRQRRAAGLGPLVFLAYGGTEVAIGSWAFVLLTSRGMGTAAAGASVTAYWGALAAGRLGIGAAGPRVSPPQVLVVSMLGAVVGGVGLWALPGAGATVALIALGLSLAGMFPALMALTPARVGPARTHRVISNQLAASVIGGAAWSAAVGVVAQRAGAWAIAPALAGACVFLAFSDLLLTASAT